ncbi:hypothetical protein F5Y11DRAFT_358556 [Daldinia sp. FL1419]|nr:hypothetical protein F5Y11DRAFT_358556 [Daldinia sp. FL1419]
MTAITKTTRGPDGALSTLTYHLPAQTTPFAPSQAQGVMPSSCSFSVYCRSLSYFVYSMNTAAHDPHPLSNQHCLAVQDIMTDSRVGYNADCWPENYFALFDNEWGELNGAPRSGNEGSASTAAFPGDKCLAGWTVACTTTITAEEQDIDIGIGIGIEAPRGSTNNESRPLPNAKVQKLYPQAWCCPPGQWTCASATGPGDRQSPQRLCQSVLTEPSSTPVWMYWDPAYDTETLDGSTLSRFEAYTWTAEVPPESDPARAATVFRKVFPLVLSSSSGVGVSVAAGAAGAAGEGSSKAVGTGVVTAVVTVTEVVVIEPDPVPKTALPLEIIGRRMEPGPVFPSRAHLPTSRCLAAILLGAAFATAAMSIFGFMLLYREKRRRGRRYPRSWTTG